MGIIVTIIIEKLGRIMEKFKVGPLARLGRLPGAQRALLGWCPLSK